jgi:hypothetical protein
MPSPQGERQNCEAMTCLPVLSGQELGWSGKVNRGERLINVVITNKPKALTGLNQKVRSEDVGYAYPRRDQEAVGEQGGPTPLRHTNGTR